MYSKNCGKNPWKLTVNKVTIKCVEKLWRRSWTKNSVTIRDCHFISQWLLPFYVFQLFELQIPQQNCLKKTSKNT